MSEPHPSTEARRRRQSCVRCFLTGLLVLVACNVGPRYTRPSVVTPTAFKEGGPEAYASLPTGTWQPARPRDATVKGKWWEMFDEPELDLLETQLNIDNQTIAEYFQNFMAARAQVEQARAGYYPTVSVNPSYTVVGAGASAAGTVAGGQSSSSTGATMAAGTTTGGATMGAAATGSARNGVTNFFSLPFDVSWAPDLWGRVRNTVHEYQYAAQVSAADLENERLTEQAALAAYYFELRGQDWLQDVYDHTVVADRNALDLTRSLVGTGIDGEVALAEAEVTLANAEAAAVGAATNRAIYEHAIATLIGRPASAFSMPVRSLTARAPAIPIGLPSQLLERRPDVAAAERTMAGANALIGVAKTAYYPSITLSGSVGVASDTLGTLFSLPAFLWSLGASASETIYDGGLRGATVAQYVATYKADVALYRQTVLIAFQQVEDYTATLRILSQQIIRQEVAVKAAQRYVDIALAQYETGIGPYLSVITAQTTLLSAEQTLVMIRVSEMTAAVQLVQALGGGWSVSQLPTAARVTSRRAAERLQGPLDTKTR